LLAALLPASAVTAAAQGAAPKGKTADVNRQDVDGSTPLQWAVYEGNAEEVQLLLKAGAKVSLANNYGVTPMELASEVGNARIIKLLLDAGANADSPNADGQTALLAVARLARAPCFFSRRTSRALLLLALLASISCPTSSAQRRRSRCSWPSP